MDNKIIAGIATGLFILSSVAIGVATSVPTEMERFQKKNDIQHERILDKLDRIIDVIIEKHKDDK